MVVCSQPYAPAAFTPRICSWYSFLLKAKLCYNFGWNGSENLLEPFSEPECRRGVYNPSRNNPKFRPDTLLLSCTLTLEHLHINICIYRWLNASLSLTCWSLSQSLPSEDQISRVIWCCILSKCHQLMRLPITRRTKWTDERCHVRTLYVSKNPLEM